MLKGKINAFEVYTLMLPYAGYWPQVHELHYEPTPEEFGKSPCLFYFRSGYRGQIMPCALPKNVPRTTIRVDGKERTIPLKTIVDLEAMIFNAFGPDYYNQNTARSCDVFYLVLEQKG